MRAKAIAAIAAAIAIAALPAGIGSATAAKPANRHPKPVYKTIKPSIDESLYLAGSHGYLIVMSLKDRQALSITVIPTSGKGFSLTKYSLKVPQRPGSELIKANLGKLGSIDVHFVSESSHHEKGPFDSCEGGKPTVEEGSFVGQIHFHGEDGYTDVDVHGADGQIATQPKLRCNLTAITAEVEELLEELGEELGKEAEKGEAEEKKEKGSGEAEEAEPDDHKVKLKAEAKGRQITFEAARLSEREPGKKGTSFTTFSVKAERHRGRIDETASASLIFEPGSAFKVPDITHLTQEGTIKPPAPFSGSATYRRESPHSLSWTGDLSVNLAGFGDVRLAGKQTTVAVCADDGCRR